MSKRIGRWLAVAMAVMVAGPALAKDWVKIDDIQAGGGAKELAVNRSVARIAIRALEGDVIINTVVVREGGKKTPYPLAIRRAKGQESYVIELGSRRQVTGLRISDGGRGVYRVSVK
ncbi:MAG: hypothetical protein PHR35_07745 [Kiritimatiellae bacterium]|nr:hypothetical protein [Kiritimatiellia bacterium]